MRRTSDVRTFLFTDIEGSTRLLDRLGEGYDDVLARHWKLVREPCEERNGEEFGAEGDAMFFSFASALDALDAAVDAQRALLANDWGDAGPVRVRMALHTGEARRALGTWLGVAVHHAARACAAGHGGQIIVSEATAAALGAGAPLRRLGEYHLRDITGPQELFQIELAGLPSGFPELRTPSARVTNLPDQATTFVGRAEEIAEVRRLVANHRLVTITGPGGAGKTRLALEVAGDAGPQFEHGVWLVELADIAAGADVASAVARAVGAPEGAPVEYLIPRQALLVLDNCEHVIEHAASLASELLARCRGIRILATSREALAVTGEHRWAVPPLRLPDDAVRLFVDRALAARADFDLAPGDGAIVQQICERLDAIPLAIELAAARVNVLTPSQILDRLTDRFGLLATTARGVQPRQQTLRALLDWSYELLAPSERAALRSLSVFAGSFTLDAATAVVGSSALADVDSLVRKSLLTAGFPAGGPPRFWLLETVRAYAHDALRDSGDEISARDAHATYFYELADEGGAKLLGPEQVEWLDRFEADVDNFRAAVEWYVVTAPDRALAIAGRLGPFFGIRSRLADGRTMLERALAATPREPAMDRLRALVAAGTIARLQADLAASRAHHEEQLAMARLLDSEAEIARALSSLGNVALLDGDNERAGELFEDSLTIRRRTGEPRSIALSLNNLGVLADLEGDFERARGYFEEHLAIMREVGDQRVVAQTLTNLGLATASLDDVDEADRLLAESLDLFRSVGDTRGVAITLAHQAAMARRRGRLDASLGMAGEALRVLEEVGDPIGVGLALETIAAALAERGGDGDAAVGARLLGAASTLPAGQAERGSAHATTARDAEQRLRALLGDVAYDAAFASGAREGSARATDLAAAIAH